MIELNEKEKKEKKEKKGYIRESFQRKLRVNN